MVPDLQHSQMHNAMTKKSILKKYIYYSPFSPFRTKSRKRVTFSEPLVASKRRKLGDVATSQPHNQPESLVKENDKENKTIDTTRNEHGSGHQKAQEINKPEMPLFAHGTIENTNPSQKAKLLMEKPVHENDSGAIMKVHPLPVDSTSPRGIISSPTQDKTENKSTEDVKTLTKNPVKCESNDPAEQIKAHESNPTKKAEVLLVHSTFNFHHEDGVDLKANIRRRRMAFNSIKLDRGSKFTHANEADLTNDTNMPKITLSPAKAHKVEIDSGEWPTKRKGPFSGKEVMVLEKRIKKFARREKLSMESLQTILQGKPSHHLKFWKYIGNHIVKSKRQLDKMLTQGNKPNHFPIGL
ncbi:hypothetical protein BJV82DRAFT_671194 [Fennellomyces sp. T-0311]|nr:hypothetical protein BJV82DRAFT_671194 [Fennellomyces sp. T-0311]